MVISSEILRVAGPVLLLVAVLTILISLVVLHLRTRRPRAENRRRSP